MDKYRIEDQHVVNALIKNNYICTKTDPHSEEIGNIHFHTQSQEEINRSKWYFINCPIKFNQKYTLPDGQIIQSNGTTLKLRHKR